MAEKKGRPVTIKGGIYEDDVSVGKNDTKSSDIYGNKEGERAAFDSVAKDTVSSEVTSQATQSGVQAVVAHVQSQVQNIGMSGLISKQSI